MTDEQARELGQRAVKCKCWHWLPGMLSDGFRVDTDPSDGRVRIVNSYYSEEYESITDEWPDLRDPATLGCMLALVREAWGVPHLFVETDGPIAVWTVRSTLEFNMTGHEDDRCLAGWGQTEAEALVAALEAAP